MVLFWFNGNWILLKSEVRWKKNAGGKPWTWHSSITNRRLRKHSHQGLTFHFRIFDELLQLSSSLKFTKAELYLIGGCQDKWFELTYYKEALPWSLLQFSLAASLSISFGSLVFRVATYWNIINVDDHYNDLDRKRTEWITGRGIVTNFNLGV